MKAQAQKIDFRIIAGYVTGALLAWAIPYLIAYFRPSSDDPWENFGHALHDMVILFYAIAGFLLLAVLSSAWGWYRSQAEAPKRTYGWVFGVSLVLLVSFLVLSVVPG